MYKTFNRRCPGRVVRAVGFGAKGRVFKSGKRLEKVSVSIQPLMATCFEPETIKGSERREINSCLRWSSLTMSSYLHMASETLYLLLFQKQHNKNKVVRYVSHDIHVEQKEKES